MPTRRELRDMRRAKPSVIDQKDKQETRGLPEKFESNIPSVRRTGKRHIDEERQRIVDKKAQQKPMYIHENGDVLDTPPESHTSTGLQLNTGVNETEKPSKKDSINNKKNNSNDTPPLRRRRPGKDTPTPSIAEEKEPPTGCPTYSKTTPPPPSYSGRTKITEGGGSLPAEVKHKDLIKNNSREYSPLCIEFDNADLYNFWYCPYCKRGGVYSQAYAEDLIKGIHPLSDNCTHPDQYRSDQKKLRLQALESKKPSTDII